MKKDNNNSCCAVKKTSIGGQALIEGIMMRAPKKSAMAVRNLQGEIVLEEWENTAKKRSKFTKLPIVRGVFNFVDSMVDGYKSLMRSAEISGLEELDAELEREKAAKKAAKAAKKAAKKGIVLTEETSESTEEAENVTAVQECENESTPCDSVETDVEAKAEAEDASENAESVKVKKDEKKDSSALTASVMVFGVLFGVLIAVGLFVFLPNFVSTLILGKNAASEHPILLAVISGVMRVCILIGYMAAVSLMKDIKRTFMYHGAEHKSIFCYEKGLELTVENVRKQTRFHPRCGTSFLFLMVFVGIMIMIPVGLLLSRILPEVILESRPLYTLVRTGITIVIMPLMMGIGYELIKIAGRHDNIVTRIISAPGLWMQRITTKEPDDSMIECAITALKAVIPDDNSDNY